MIIREPHTPVPPPSIGEILGAIAIREDYAAELHAMGRHEDAKRQWLAAEAYRLRVDEMRRAG